ncbi:hypothetical protein ACFL1M_04290 [Patescibacteria group bacterium]
MAIADDFFVDYYNKLVVHSPSTVTYTGLSGTFQAGETVTWSGGAQSAIINTDNGATAMDIVYATNTPTGTITGATSTATATFSTITTKTTTYTSRALYSYLQDTFDELGQLDDTVPMSAQTPTEFTLINGWFIDDETVKFLTGGAITTSGYSSAIRMLTFASAAYVSVTPDQIGGEVGYDGGSPAHTGTLLHYNNTTRKWWVRTTDAFSDTGTAIDIDDGGTNNGTLSVASVTGEDLYANIYTLGTIATDPKPETYIFQNSSSISPWWGRGDSNAHIDVLIKVSEAGTEIDGAAITVFVRNYGDLYDHFPIDLTNGGRNAVPLASATDLNNNTTGEGYLLYDAESVAFTVGLIVTGGTSAATAEVLAVTDWGSEGVLTLGHIKGVFQDNETITDSGSGSATSNGTIGYSYVTYSSEAGGGFSVSDTVTGATSGATGTLRGLQDDGTTGKLVIEPTNYSDYSAAENLQVTASTRGVADAAATRSVVAYDDIKITFMNTTLDFASNNGTVVEGDALTGGTSGATCVFIEEVDANTIAIGNVDETAGTIQASERLEIDVSNGYTLAGTLNRAETHTINRNFTQGTAEPYSILIDCAGREMSEVYEWLKYVTRESGNSTDQINYQTMYPLNNGSIVAHDGEEYINARYAPDTVFTPVKASPFGTFAGGKFFGARGVWVFNMDNADIQAFQLIDSDGDTQTPPNFQSITISNLLSGDRVLVARTSSGTTIDKAVYTLSSGAGDNEASDGTVVTTTAISSDTPDSGYVRLVQVADTSINREERYAYTSWTGSTFTLSGTLSRAYDSGSDTAYVPYIDTSTTSTSETVTIIYSTDRTVVARIRRYNGAGDSILPFETTGTFGSTGYSAVTIRNDDPIVT